MSYQKFLNEVKKQGYTDFSQIDSLARTMYRHIVTEVTDNAPHYEEPITAIFDFDKLAAWLESRYPFTRNISHDSYTIADDLAMAFTFAYCEEVGMDVYLPGGDA